MRQILTVFFSLALACSAAYAKDPETFSVTVDRYDKWVSLDASLEAIKSATVSAQTSGRIIKLHYDVNDRVPEGAAILEITAVEQGAQVAGAQADVARSIALNRQAQLQLQRYKELFPKGAISKGAMDDAIANAKASEQAVTASKAKLAQAQESANYTLVTAPFSGIVTQRHVQVGETVSPGQPLLSGYATDKIRAVTHVPQRYIKALRTSPTIEIELSTGKRYNSNKVTVFQFADPISRSYQVRINLPENEPGLTPGNWAKASFINGQYDAIYIPLSAVITVNELNAVYIQHDNKLILNQIRLGRTKGDQVEVLAGLASGDVIARDAYQALLERTSQQDSPNGQPTDTL